MKKPLPFGKFLLLDRINVGGMAEVFMAKAGGEGDRLLAIKKIIPTMVEDEEFITMFLDEARIAVQLNHANIVQIYELGKVEEHYFIAMEYVSGRDLRFMLDAAKKRRKLLPLPLTAFLTRAICEGLEYAHRKKDAQGKDMSIVHRDVSPQNVLVSYQGDVKIIDFGIAKAQNRSQKTQAGILKGKFGYMSPEQVRGLPIDRRSDIFALGVVLYEMLTGERLFVGESDFSTLEKVRNAQVLPPREFNEAIPPALEAIVLRSLAREPEQRYQWAAEMAEDLSQLLSDGGLAFSSELLRQYLHEEFTPELQRESERLARFAALAPSQTGTPSQPPGAGARWTDETFRLSEQTELVDPSLGPPAGSSALTPVAAPPSFTQEDGAVDAATILHFPDGAVEEPKTVIKGDVALAARPWPSGQSEADEEAKTVIKAELGLAAAPDPGMPPTVRLLPRQSSQISRSRNVSTALALAGGVAAGLLLLALPVLWLRGHERVQRGTLVITPVPAQDVAVSVDGRPVAEANHHTFVARGLVPGDHIIEAKNKNGLRVLKVTLRSGETEPVQIATAAEPPAPAPPPAPVAPTGPPAVVERAPSGLAGSGPSASAPAAVASIKVTVVTDPPDAELFVDHKSVGQGPFVLVSSDPTHLYRLRAVAPGHHAAERSARFAGDETVNLVLRESKRRPHGGVTGSLILSSKPVAKVFVDGRSTDRYTPIPPSAPLELPSGDHLLHLESDDGKKADLPVTIAPHAVKKLLGVPLN